MKARLQKSIVYTFLVLTTGLFSATFTGCNTDKCKTITCANNGTCLDGSCTCRTGYLGPQCETVNRTRFLGNWIVTEDGTLTNAAQYGASIKEGTAIDRVKITNFYNLATTPIEASVDGDTLIIQSQNFEIFLGPTRKTYTVEGRGVLTATKYYKENGRIQFNYSLTDELGNKDDFGLGLGESSVWEK